ncbi:MAG: hypothetical protein K6347_02695 [Campylobacterales bacterium]
MLATLLALTLLAQPPSLSSPGLKDRLLSFLVGRLIEGYLSEQGIGRARSFHIDTTTKQLRLEVDVEGEDKPLVLHAASYRFEKVPVIDCCTKKPTGETHTYLIITNITTNKPWLNAASRTWLKEVRLPLSDSYAAIAEIVF